MITTVRSLVAAALLLFPAAAFAYDDAEAQKTAEYMKKYRFETVTTKEGLVFSIPSDMPIETRGGLVAPIPFEEYLYIKIKLLEERFKSLEDRLGRMEEKIFVKFEELKAEIRQKDAKSGPPQQRPS